MRKFITLFGFIGLCCTMAGCGSALETPLMTQDIRIRDPFIYADKQHKTYYMYAQSKNRADSDFTGVEVYASKDLVHWTQPRPALVLPEADYDVQMVWAPEMHKYNGMYYLFATLTLNRNLPEKQPVEGKWPGMSMRGTYIFRANNPLGPFKPLKETSHTPEDWMALDGTLYVENGKPYMVFCHEWIQVVDGTMDYIQLKDDLSDVIGEPNVMFKASDAPGADLSPTSGKVTDGCYLYRSPLSGRLFMIWSTFIPGKEYCVVLTRSESGKISGPWKEQKLIYTQNGGHGMLFKTFDNHLMMAIHQPNTGGREKLHLFGVIDNGDTLTIDEEAN